MDHVIEYDVTFLEAALVREGEALAPTRWPAPGDRAGSTPDDPPAGWLRSPRATFVRGADEP